MTDVFKLPTGGGDLVTTVFTNQLRWFHRQGYEPVLQQKWITRNLTTGTVDEGWRDVPVVMAADLEGEEE